MLHNIHTNICLEKNPLMLIGCQPIDQPEPVPPPFHPPFFQTDMPLTATCPVPFYFFLTSISNSSYPSAWSHQNEGSNKRTGE